MINKSLIPQVKCWVNFQHEYIESSIWRMASKWPVLEKESDRANERTRESEWMHVVVYIVHKLNVKHCTSIGELNTSSSYNVVTRLHRLFRCLVSWHSCWICMLVSTNTHTHILELSRPRPHRGHQIQVYACVYVAITIK